MVRSSDGGSLLDVVGDSTSAKAVNIAQRIVALFLVNALGVVTGAAVVAPDLELWRAAALAGAVAVFKVVESLARASLDGKLSRAEIDTAFTEAKARRRRPR